ncbi:hypothetical protein [Rhodococcus gannanensis]|uniref:PE-PPE domain-containing protein n=1 Tax=Rhodococcus gannanensis TaxID=1960308 RepID=A0ABW4PDE2_9NOCA
MEAIADDPAFADKAIVLIGHSQGAEASANAYEQAIEEGLLVGHVSAAVIMADPRGPWGVKAWLDGRPLLRWVGAPLLGVEADGARDPEAVTDGYTMTQIIVVGDPVATMQWRFLRPVSSAIVVYAGWATLHGADNPWSTPSLFRRTAENTAGLDDPLALASDNGNVTYMIYDAYHPVAVLQAQWERDLGMLDTEAEFVARVQELDPRYDRWFEITKPTIDNAAVPVTTPPAPPVVPDGEFPVVVESDTGDVPDEAVVIANAPLPGVAASASTPAPAPAPAPEPAAEPASEFAPARPDPITVSESDSEKARFEEEATTRADDEPAATPDDTTATDDTTTALDSETTPGDGTAGAETSDDETADVEPTAESATE